MDDQKQEEYMYRVRKHLKEKFRKEEGRALKRKFADAERVSTGEFFAVLFTLHLYTSLTSYPPTWQMFLLLFLFFLKKILT
jgi:hypothetical protein